MGSIPAADAASIPSCDAVKTVADLPPKRGPVRILCDEIGFQFDPRLERPEVLIAFVAELLSEVQHHHDMAVSIADYTGKVPPESSSLALGLAWVMVRASLREILASAAAVHDLAHELNPDEAYPTNHTIDMVSSCASAIRFGLEEKAWSSRHAAAASNHVWKRVYGVSRFDRNTPAWQHEWARSKLLSAIVSLLPTEATTANSVDMSEANASTIPPVKTGEGGT